MNKYLNPFNMFYIGGETVWPKDCNRCGKKFHPDCSWDLMCTECLHETNEEFKAEIEAEEKLNDFSQISAESELKDLIRVDPTELAG